MAQEKSEKYSLRNEDKELLTLAWKEFNVSWQTMTLDPWEKANEARKRWLFWKLKIYRWWWNPRGWWKVLPKYRSSKGGQFFPSVSFLGNYKLYILVKHKPEKGAQLGADYRPKDGGEGTRASCHGSWRRKTTDLLINSMSFHSWCLSPLSSCHNGLQTAGIYFSLLYRPGSPKSQHLQVQCPVRTHFLVHKWPSFHCVLWWQEEARERAGGGALTRPHPHDLITTQHPHTED